MKQQRARLTLGLFLLVVSFLFVVSCAQKKGVDVSGTAGESVEAAETEEQTAGQAEEEISEEELAAQREAEREAELKRQQEAQERTTREFVNENVYFGFDDATLTRKAREILAKKAEWLRSNPDAEVVIEGHCDERGTKEYNMALGQRRAQSIKNFLVNAGIDADRLDTISYGEERPADPRHNEEAWAKNRRGHFRIK